MNTDKLFHEYFHTAPQAVFELAQIKPTCNYQYVSPVVKASERRLDGFLKPQIAGEPYYFIEIQGYKDPLIYWRGISQIGLSHEQNKDLDGQNWQAIFFFLDADYDPGPKTLGPLYPARKRWLIRKVLPKVLGKIQNPLPELNVLLPLAADSIDEVEQKGSQWVEQIRNASNISKSTEEKLISLLVQFLGQRFTDLPRKEIDRMLQLTPFEETRAGKEYIEEGIQTGIQTGIHTGTQQTLRQTISETLGFRFTQIGKAISERIEQINDTEHLKILFKQALSVDSLTQFEQLLQEKR